MTVGITELPPEGMQLPGVSHLPHTLNIEKAAFTRGQPAWGAHLADELERIVSLIKVRAFRARAQLRRRYSLLMKERP